MVYKFPENFLWGAATSAHQAEGSNHNDWTEWEALNAQRLAAEATGTFEHTVPRWELIRNEATDPNNYISGLAADHYHQFKADIAILKSLHLNTYRFTIEWSRVEPREGVWDTTALQHYATILAELRSNSIQPMVTLWHRTNPVWVRDLGGWENKKTVEYFLRFVEKISTDFGAQIPYWTVLNSN